MKLKIAVIGPKGCGKTTLISRMVNGTFDLPEVPMPNPVILDWTLVELGEGSGNFADTQFEIWEFSTDPKGPKGPKGPMSHLNRMDFDFHLYVFDASVQDPEIPDVQRPWHSVLIANKIDISGFNLTNKVKKQIQFCGVKHFFTTSYKSLYNFDRPWSIFVQMGREQGLNKLEVSDADDSDY